MFISMSSYDMANHRLDVKNEEDKVNSEDANNYAMSIMIEETNKENVAQLQQSPPEKAPPSLPPPQIPQQPSQQPSQQVYHQSQQHLPPQMNTNTPSFSERVPNMNIQQRPMSTDISGFDTVDNFSTLSHTPMTQNTYKPSANSINSPQSNNFNIGGFDNTETQYQSF
jgi:hypothetical protein